MLRNKRNSRKRRRKNSSKFGTDAKATQLPTPNAMVPKILNPEYKAMRSKGLTHCGKITFKQFKYLVKHGHDPAKLQRWTMRRASLAIGKIITRENAAAQAGHDILKRELDERLNDPNS